MSTVALVGAGTIGGGWAATYLVRGWDVLVCDPAPEAEARLLDHLRHVWPSVRLTVADAPDAVPAGRLRFVVPQAWPDVAGGADLVHESGPEDVAVKRDIYRLVESGVGPHTPILSSSGGLMPTDLQAEMARPERFVVAHPLAPVYALPLVEVIAGTRTAPSTVDEAVRHLTGLGKRPIVLRRELPGYLTNRLTFALLREAVHCLAEGVADARSIEEAVVYGVTPRYVRGGALTSLALAGGPGGMRVAMGSFAPAIEGWWSDLGSPHLTDEVKALLVDAADAIIAGRALADVLAERDAAVVDMVAQFHSDTARRPA